MERVIGFIDVGFLRAEGAQALGYPKRKVQVDAQGCVDYIQDAFCRSDAQFLRAYWYDGAFDPRDRRYRTQKRVLDAIASVPGIQLRLGHLRKNKPRWQHAVKKAVENCGVDPEEFQQHFQFRPELEQKGVDTRIALDLVRLAQRHAYDVAVLISGDRDLAEPVRWAQDEGRAVVVASPHGKNVATEVRQLADRFEEIGEPDLRSMLRVSEPATGDDDEPLTDEHPVADQEGAQEEAADEADEAEGEGAQETADEATAPG